MLSKDNFPIEIGFQLVSELAGIPIGKVTIQTATSCGFGCVERRKCIRTRVSYVKIDYRYGTEMSERDMYEYVTVIDNRGWFYYDDI